MGSHRKRRRPIAFVIMLFRDFGVAIFLTALVMTMLIFISQCLFG